MSYPIWTGRKHESFRCLSHIRQRVLRGRGRTAALHGRDLSAHFAGSVGPLREAAGDACVEISRGCRSESSPGRQRCYSPHPPPRRELRRSCPHTFAWLDYASSGGGLVSLLATGVETTRLDEADSYRSSAAVRGASGTSIARQLV